MGNPSSLISYCMPVVPSADLEKSLRFWVEGLGLTADRHMRQDDRLVGCMVHNDDVYLWLNQKMDGAAPGNFDGIRLYWTPLDIHAAREHFEQMGFEVSEIEDRDYGQTEFFLTDDDGYSHCFGVATKG